ncbi:WGR domain-containing protein [Nocardiopsis gilva]|uniref:WGR domain-containing protein n=1 Tax=Nocardiopsis gilva TaxID=280236 RepID=UPI000361FD1F|nr:WGR domain-containing protein [Nocardiopsis gilva]
MQQCRSHRFSSFFRTRLKPSDEGDGGHKFYEVVTPGTEAAVRFGRDGKAEPMRVANCATPAKAAAAASKKIAEKLRKGYAPAVQGVRKRRPVTRRQIVRRRSTARRASVLW